jgi:transcription elongation GreA/GreB family factor
MEDLHRQRVLERAGWTFWRCWASSFVRDPEPCMADLCRMLGKMGIEPIGAVDVDLTEVVAFREIAEDATGTEPSQGRGNGAEEVRQDELLTTESELPLWTRSSEARKPSLAAEVGDSVRYCFVDAQEDEAFVTIVPYESKPNLGLINAETAVAKTLLGLEEGHEREVLLPGGRRRLRVLSVHKRDSR